METREGRLCYLKRNAAVEFTIFQELSPATRFFPWLVVADAVMFTKLSSPPNVLVNTNLYLIGGSLIDYYHLID
jgi:hypothetical protein